MPRQHFGNPGIPIAYNGTLRSTIAVLSGAAVAQVCRAGGAQAMERVTRVHDAVYRITTPYVGGGVVFLYLIRGERTALVDTGVKGSPQGTITPALAEIGLGMGDVDLILTTHGHHDHAGGNLEAKQLTGAPIHLHQGDLPMARSLDAELEYHLPSMRTLEFADDVVEARARLVAETAGVEKAEVDVVWSGGEVVDLGRGVSLRVVHTPGHTAGSVCLYWEAEGLLLTADAVQGMGPRAGSFPYYTDAVAYRRSLRSLAELDIRLLCSGHAALGGGVINEPSRRGDEARLFLEDSIWVADTIHGAVASAMERLPDARPREVVLAALAELIYSIPQVHLRGAGMPALAGRTLLAHMEAARLGSYPS